MLPRVSSLYWYKNLISNLLVNDLNKLNLILNFANTKSRLITLNQCQTDFASYCGRNLRELPAAM